MLIYGLFCQYISGSLVHCGVGCLVLGGENKILGKIDSCASGRFGLNSCVGRVVIFVTIAVVLVVFCGFYKFKTCGDVKG